MNKTEITFAFMVGVLGVGLLFFFLPQTATAEEGGINLPDITKISPVSPTMEEHCVDGKCVARIHTAPAFAVDPETSEFRNVTDIVKMEFNQALLNISYKNSQYVTFEPYFIYDGTQYSVAQAKTFMDNNNIGYDVDILDQKSNWKFAFNFSNLPPVTHDKIHAVGFQVKDFYGFNANDVTYLTDTKVRIKNFDLELGDVIGNNYNLSFPTPTSFEIGNLSANIVDNYLWIDPQVHIGNETGGAEISNQTYVSPNAGDTNYGTSTVLGVRYSSCCGPLIQRSYIDLNMSAGGIPIGSTIDSATLTLTSGSGQYQAEDGSTAFYNVTDTSFVTSRVQELSMTWNSGNTCGTTWGSMSSTCNSTALGTITPVDSSANVEYSVDVTAEAQSVIDSTATFMLMFEMQDVETNTNHEWQSKRNSLAPYFTISYTEGGTPNTAPHIDSIAPIDNMNTSSIIPFFNFSATDYDSGDETFNATLFLHDGFSQLTVAEVNVTNNTVSTYDFDDSGIILSSGNNFTWRWEVNDNNGGHNISSNHTFYIDSNAPTMSQFSPVNQTGILELGTTEYQNFTVNVTDDRAVSVVQFQINSSTGCEGNIILTPNLTVGFENSDILDSSCQSGGHILAFTGALCDQASGGFGFFSTQSEGFPEPETDCGVEFTVGLAGLKAGIYHYKWIANDTIPTEDGIRSVNNVGDSAVYELIVSDPVSQQTPSQPTGSGGGAPPIESSLPQTGGLPPTTSISDVFEDSEPETSGFQPTTLGKIFIVGILGGIVVLAFIRNRKVKNKKESRPKL